MAQEGDPSLPTHHVRRGEGGGSANPPIGVKYILAASELARERWLGEHLDPGW